jgi:SAM-dependent methyltransferase
MAAAWDKVGKLKEVLRDLRLFRVLDPACGSGNFLYVAYRELKRLEREILLRLSEISKGEPLETAVSIHQFFGIDIQPFAVELAKVTLMLAKEQEVRETAKLEEIEEGFLVLENPLPLDNLDKNILCADALFTDWPKADAIIGNPPFISKNKLVPELGQAYVDKVRKKFPLVSGRADFCTYWFRLAHEHLEVGARAGLVATNTIRQNYSREGSLDYVVANGGTITDAVGTQVWSGDAVVHVSIINWINGASLGLKRLTTQLGDSVESPWHAVELETISAALSESTDVTTASVIHGNANSSACFQGQTHGHEGFLLTAGELSGFADSASVIHPYLTADELFSNQGGKPNRYSIDLNRCDDLFEARQFPSAFERVKERVLPDIQTKATDEFEKTGKSAGPRQTHFNKWWKFWRGRLEMLGHIESSDRYIVCGQVTKRPIFEFLSSSIRPNAALIVFPVADDYSFGVLQSVIHFEWFKARCSSLKGDFRYTSNTVFDTFPWPQTPTRPQIEAVAKEAVALRQLRREVMAKMNWSLRDLYRTLEEPGSNPLRDAQARLDTAVRAAYAMPKDADILAFLLALNQTCAAQEAAGEKITPPGLPLPVEEHGAFVTEDCIKVQILACP